MNKKIIGFVSGGAIVFITPLLAMAQYTSTTLGTDLDAVTGSFSGLLGVFLSKALVFTLAVGVIVGIVSLVRWGIRSIFHRR